MWALSFTAPLRQPRASLHQTGEGIAQSGSVVTDSPVQPEMPELLFLSL